MSTESPSRLDRSIASALVRDGGPVQCEGRAMGSQVYIGFKVLPDDSDASKPFEETSGSCQAGLHARILTEC